MKMHFTEMVCVVVVLGYVMGSPPAKRTALTIGSHGQSELRKRELLQTYLNFFYASARLAGFTDDRIFGGAPENKGCPEKNVCKDGWVSFKGHCYLFVDTDKLDWENAKKSCLSEDAHLAVIETDEENRFLKDFITRLFKNRGSLRMGFWIAGLEVGGEGNWHWYPDNSALQYSDFQSGHISSSTSENCLILWGHFNFKWADHFCNEANYYVCEN